MTAPLLDPQKIATARIAAGVGASVIAQRLGVSVPIIVRLEAGENQRILPFGFIADLAAELQVPLDELLAEPMRHDEPVSDDDVVVEALLAERGAYTSASDIATLLGWTTKRVIAAAATLARRLEGTGLELRRTGWQQFRLAASPHALNPRTRERIARYTPRKFGLTRGRARLLLAAARGELDGAWARQTNNFDRLTVASLARQGLIYKPAGRNTTIQLTDEARLGLAIDPLEHLKRRPPPGGEDETSTTGLGPRPPSPLATGCNNWSPGGIRRAAAH